MLPPLSLIRLADIIVRSDLEKLTTRVNVLERGSSGYQSRNILDAGVDGPRTTTPTTTNPRVSPNGSSNESAHYPTVVSYRGSTTPWETLVSHVSDNPSLVASNDDFREDVRRLAEDERTIRLTHEGVVFSLAERLPGVPSAYMLNLVWEYVREAPYPIVWWEGVIAVATRLIESGWAASYGEVVTVLVVSFAILHVV